MAGLKEIRTRIGSIKTTRQVTSAMKMVSAAKLKKAQDAVINFRPYALRFHEIFDSARSGAGAFTGSEFSLQKEQGSVLVVLVTSNRGLCGGFNAGITASAIELVHSKYKKELKEGKVGFLAIGKQGERILRNHHLKIEGNQNDLLEALTFDKASAVCSGIIEDFSRGVYNRIEIVHNEFINAAQYTQVNEVFLPLQNRETSPDDSKGDTIFEPSRTEVIEGLIPMWLRILFYKSLLVSLAAEHGARMTAMHQATDNATDLLSELTLEYNKARQTAITNEILEITAGAEALRR